MWWVVIKDGGRRLVTERGAVLKVWERYFKELLNREGSSSELELPYFVEGKVELVEITEEEVQMALKRTKKRRAPCIDEVCTEMIIAVGEVRVSWVKRLLNVCVREGSIPEEWRTGLIVPIWKQKENVQDPRKYRGMMLLNHVMKVLERILDGRIRKGVEMEIRDKRV